MVETTLNSIITRVKKNQIEILMLALVLALAAFLRFYRIEEYMTFLGDEGRDAIIVKRAIVDLDIPLIGPPTSIGNIYLGPLYYYMMMVPFALTNFNPVSAAVMVAVLGVATVWLIFYFAKKWFGAAPGLAAAFLYAISPVTIIYSRSSWNPNPAPFFSLLAVLGVTKARESKNWKWFILTGISLAFVVQMHYLALVLLPVFGAIWLVEIINKKNAGYCFFWRGTFISIASFFALMSPLLIFDMRHNFINSNAMWIFFNQRETTVNINPFNTLTRIWPVFQEKLVSRYVVGENLIFNYIIIGIILVVIIQFLSSLQRKKTHWGIFVLFVWLVGGLLGLSLYKQNIYDHYLGFIAPTPYLILAAFLYLLPKKISAATALILTIILGWLNFQKSPLLFEPNMQLSRTREIARYIIKESEEKPFNFALIAEHNYDAAYQFYLDIYNHKPKTVPFDITSQLFVVCEDKICQPVNHPKYEIAAFGWVKVIKEETVAGMKLYKLTHNNQ